MRNRTVDQVHHLLESRCADGEHDIWRLLTEPLVLRAVVGLFIDSLSNVPVTHICGPESRGFLLGGLLAHELGKPFVPARKRGRFMPGDVRSETTAPDWEGKRVEYMIRRGSIPTGSNVVLVDDWFTTGNHFRAIQTIVEAEGSRLDHARVIVSERTDLLDAEGVDLRVVLHWSELEERFHEESGQVI